MTIRTLALRSTLQKLTSITHKPVHFHQPVQIIQQHQQRDESVVLKNLSPSMTITYLINKLAVDLTMNEVIQYSENDEYEMLWFKDALERLDLNDRPIRFLNGKWWVYDLDRKTGVTEWTSVTSQKVVAKTFERFYNNILKTYTEKYQEFKGDKGEYHLEIFRNLLEYEETAMVDKRTRNLERIKPLVKKN
jgi:hypothetical protein